MNSLKKFKNIVPQVKRNVKVTVNMVQNVFFHPNLSVLYYAYFTKQNHHYYFLIIKKINTKHCKTI